MGTKLHGITVTLYQPTQTGTDAFGNPIITETAVQVENVLIGEPSADDVTTSQQLYGKKVVYTLGIPRTDFHAWENSRVYFFGRMFRTFGEEVTGIDDLIPLDWNRKIKVERYGEED